MSLKDKDEETNSKNDGRLIRQTTTKCKIERLLPLSMSTEQYCKVHDVHSFLCSLLTFTHFKCYISSVSLGQLGLFTS